MFRPWRVSVRINWQVEEVKSPQKARPSVAQRRAQLKLGWELLRLVHASIKLVRRTLGFRRVQLFQKHLLAVPPRGLLGISWEVLLSQGRTPGTIAQEGDSTKTLHDQVCTVYHMVVFSHL